MRGSAFEFESRFPNGKIAVLVTMTFVENDVFASICLRLSQGNRWYLDAYVYFSQNPVF